VHPQRWGYNVDRRMNPMLAQASWYRDVCAGLDLRPTRT
jgi:hypothetical protein